MLQQRSHRRFRATAGSAVDSGSLKSPGLLRFAFPLRGCSTESIQKHETAEEHCQRNPEMEVGRNGEENIVFLRLTVGHPSLNCGPQLAEMKPCRRRQFILGTGESSVNNAVVRETDFTT
jgi:hypothetical protein